MFLPCSKEEGAQTSRFAATKIQILFITFFNQSSPHLPPVRERPLELPVDILLELLHVEYLEWPLRLQLSPGRQADNVVGHGGLLKGVQDEDGGAGEALHKDVALWKIDEKTF